MTAIEDGNRQLQLIGALVDTNKRGKGFMSEKKMYVRLPALPAPDFFGVAEHSILTADGKKLLSYDCRTQAGFVYYMEDATWSISAPIAFEAWAALVSAAGLEVAGSPDARRWIDACLAGRAANPAGLN